MPPLGPHPVQKSSWKMQQQRQPQTLCCCVPRILVSLPNVCFQAFWSSRNQSYCILPGFRSSWNQRDFGVLWNQNSCIFQGFWISVLVEPKLLYFTGRRGQLNRARLEISSYRSLQSQKERLRQSHHAWKTRLQDQGAHACVIFCFYSSLQNKSEQRNFLLLKIELKK